MKLQVVSAPDGTCIHYGGVIEGSRNDFWLYKCNGLSRAMTHQETGVDEVPVYVDPKSWPMAVTFIDIRTCIDIGELYRYKQNKWNKWNK